MSHMCTKFVPALRNISPRLRERFLPCNGFQRYYWRRRDAFSELSSAMQSIENYMKEMDKEVSRVFGGLQSASPVKLPRFISPLDLGKVREIPVVSTGDGRSYKLELDMQGMEPENINITLRNNELTVVSRQDEKREDGSRFVRENTYHYTLPDDINPDTIRSSLTDGVLTIEAPLPALESKEIPVTVESGQKSKFDNSDEKK